MITFKKIIPWLVVFGFLFIQKTSAQTIYQDSVRTSFSVSTTYGNTFKKYYSFGVGGNVSFKNGISIGFLRTKYLEYSVNEYRRARDGKGWGGYISLMIADELKGNALGIEAGFIYNRQTYKEKRESYEDPYELYLSSFGTGVSFSKRFEVTKNSFLLPQTGFNFMPITKGEKTEERSTEAIAFKYSIVSLGLGFVKHKEEYSWIIDSGATLDLSSVTISGVIGLSILF